MMRVVRTYVVNIIILQALFPSVNAVHILYMTTYAGSAFSKLQLEAGDDAGAVTWVSASRQLELYASHKHFIKKVVEMHNAAW